MFAGADYQLAWPRDLFVDEAERVLRGPGLVSGLAGDGGWRDEVELLLEEAFVGSAARDEFRKGDSSGFFHGDAGSQFLRRLVEAAGSFPQPSDPKPYWPARHSAKTPDAIDRDVAQRLFVRIIDDFSNRGYLDRAMPSVCVDDHESTAINPADVLEERLGIPRLWPLSASVPWDDDTWFGLIEVFHDLVARPRKRSWHNYAGCGWHYSHFALEPARRLYRWKLDELLERARVGYRLASEGEDEGRLVATTDEARAALVQRLIATTAPSVRDRVAHAIALFRSRSSSVEEKRSACIALAGILEERRPQLRALLVRKDEGALFEVANQFAIRHQGALQRGDYDPAFLDWIFWWYAATVELSDRLGARASTTPTSLAPEDGWD